MKGLIFPILVLSSLFISAARADTLVYEAHTPATSNYISYCDGTYHGLRYCDFTDTFSVGGDQVVTALTWYDLGCDSLDEANMTLLFDLANADTYTVVAETAGSVQLTCGPNYPPGHNNPTTLPINPTTLVAGQHYFILLRASSNERARAYSGPMPGTPIASKSSVRRPASTGKVSGAPVLPMRPGTP